MATNPESVAPELANDLARISKMGALLEFARLFTRVSSGEKFEIDKQAVIDFWLAKAPEIERWHAVGQRSLRIEADKMVWWRLIGLAYGIDERV